MRRIQNIWPAGSEPSPGRNLISLGAKKRIALSGMRSTFLRLPPETQTEAFAIGICQRGKTAYVNQKGTK